MPTEALALVSSFLGVFFGFLLGIWWERRQDKKKDNRLRLETSTSIVLELRGICGSIAKTFELWEEKKLSPVPHIDFSTDAKNSAVASGRFILFCPEIQSKISHAYAVIDRAVDYRSRMLEPRPDHLHASRFTLLSDNFRGQITHLLEVIPPLVEELETA